MNIQLSNITRPFKALNKISQKQQQQGSYKNLIQNKWQLKFTKLTKIRVKSVSVYLRAGLNPGSGLGRGVTTKYKYIEAFTYKLQILGMNATEINVSPLTGICDYNRSHVTAPRAVCTWHTHGMQLESRRHQQRHRIRTNFTAQLQV